MNVELSERMQAVVRLVSKTEAAADVGCDHGYVAIWLVQNHICHKVIAMDVNKGPLLRAKENIRAYGLEDYIETRLSNGTQALEKNEINTLVCAGMGGRLMIQILEEGADKISGMEELVLQPQSEIRQMRAYLRNKGMHVVAEDMVRDEDKFYPMMKVRVSGNKQDMASSKSDWEQRMEDTYGPCLLRDAHPVLQQFLQKRYEICQTIKRQMQQAANDRQKARIKEIEEEMRDIDLVLQQYYG